MKRIGVISDTHDLVRPEAAAALAGSELIIHAGDITEPEVLDALREIAPVIAVRGNNDEGAWADALPETATVDVEGAKLFVIHDVKQLRRPPEGCAVVIAGHSHRPSMWVSGGASPSWPPPLAALAARFACDEVKDGVLWLNPGSAGPRRWSLPVCVARLVVSAGEVSAEVVHLDVAPPKTATARRRPRRGSGRS